MRLRGLDAREGVDKVQGRPVSVAGELDLDRRRTGRRALLVLPTPGEDEAVRCIELDEFASRSVSRDDLAAVEAAGLGLERAGLAHPARRLVRVNEELPDRLRTCFDRERPLDRRRLSGCVHAFPSPPFLLRV